MMTELSKYSPANFVEAFKYGVQGKLLGVSMNSYQTFGMLFLEEVMRAYNMYLFDHRPKPKLLAASNGPGEKEIFNIMRNGVIASFETYKTTKRIMDYGNPKYEWLVSCGLITFSPEVEAELLKKAIQDVEQGYECDMLNVFHSYERNRIKNIKNNPDNPEYQAAVLSVYREMSLKKYYDGLIRRHKEIEQVLPTWE
jgi:hypothetical protein